jgi:CheY-like chemotaxis protein
MSSQIIIVEDERLVAQDIAQILKDVGYTVCAIASDGKTAIQKITEFSPDLVLLDIRIKGEIDGVEVGEHIRSFFAIPVIYLTAFSDTETLNRAQSTHPMGYVLKPFRREQLLSSITIALSTYQAQKQKLSPQTLKNQPNYRLKSTITPFPVKE